MHSSAIFLPNVAPEIILQPENVTVDSGRGLTLACVAHGYPLVDITWYSNGDQVTNGSFLIYESFLEESNVSFTQSILEICPIMLEDGGQYECYANNTHGNSTVMFQVIVNQGTLL